VSDTPGGPAGNQRQQGIAAAITEVSERASVLIREEIELAKTEITEKTTRLAKGAVVAIVAGVFFLTALFFVLIGCAWLLYYELPIGSDFTYFWGFFAMAVILVVLGVIAGLLAAKVVKSGAPPAPTMAIEEARKIRETVSSSSDAKTSTGAYVPPAAQVPSSPPVPVPSPPATPAAHPTVTPAPATSATTQPPAPAKPAPPQEPPAETQAPTETKPDSDDLGRGTIDGPTLGS
jgi:Putative Actinobacterial Holin-X, holin superfamily III